MNIVREKYETLLKCLYNLCISSTSDELDEFKRDVAKCLSEIEYYNLFPITLSEDFFESLKRKHENFESVQSSLANQLYVYLGALCFHFEYRNIVDYENTVNYPKYLEICRTRLPYRIVSQWQINFLNESKFSFESFFFILNRNALTITNEEDYKKYRTSLGTPDLIPLSSYEEKTIPNKIWQPISDFLNLKLQSYKDYIETNYPLIKDEFLYYKSDIYCYPIDSRNDDENVDIMYMYVYDSSASGSLTVSKKFLSFHYRFHNIEPFHQHMKNGVLLTFNTDRMNESFPFFDEKEIVREAVNIYCAHVKEEDYKQFVIYVLRANGSKISDNLGLNRITYDGKEAIILYSQSFKIPDLENLIEKTESTIVIFKVRPDQDTLNYLNQRNIKAIVINEYIMDMFNNDNYYSIHLFLKEAFRQSEYVNGMLKSHYSEGARLLNALSNCPSGQKGWRQFEDIGTEIFSYLFKESFRNYQYKLQANAYENTIRRDLIIHNTYNNNSFWSRVKHDFNANIIVIDFKNYSEPLRQNDFYIATKYLNDTSGRFGIIVSRKGIDASAKIIQKNEFCMKNTLLLSLDEKDLREMIQEKMNGVDPIYRLENMLFELYQLN